MQPSCESFSHTPSALQTSVVHEVPSAHSSAVSQRRQPGIGVLTQLPSEQASPVVQGLPSLHVVPSVAVGFEQAPDSGSQVPATWHWSDAVQTFGFPPVQVPPSQVSDWVQASPSLQLVPSDFAGLEQRPLSGLQVPAS